MSAHRVASAARLALRSANPSVFRCASEHTLSRTSTATATATTRTARRCYGTPAYQQYSLYPNNAPPPPRAEAKEPLPAVNETRPPKTSSAASNVASTTLEVEQPAKRSAARAGSTAPTTTTTTPPSSSAAATTTISPPTPKAATAATTSPAATPAAAAAAASPPKTARPRPKLRARKAAMKLTAAAVEQLQAMLEGPDPKLIKVGVRNRGCSGLAYHLEWVDRAGSFDEEVVQDGVKVLIDSKALFSIIGSEMDWVEDKLSQRFVFKNPNIKEECGCGESFMV
ncbi:Iron-sulfur assembly protein 1 [Verticillium nonalfalfae]|uniref:Iron-sulfur assembly protein 1 n=1 Tax=Verticillium nonalfalfae TaxID=1051616 RepID=A0A3M9Y5N2_9PEZI|nr:Iron-sulfur assembly protein 1 [Verticillium nonalfalfae]RNJ54788.1 Iron-sulfur assembly protein 1 [Verticillium nonalfalfae]